MTGAPENSHTVLVTGATAEIPVEVLFDGVRCGVGVVAEGSVDGHDDARGAEATLAPVHGSDTGLHGVKSLFHAPDAFHCRVMKVCHEGSHEGTP